MSESYRNRKHHVNPASTAGKPIERRSVLKGAAGVAGAAAIGPRITFAQDASPAASPASEQTVVPSGVDGVPDVYLQYPDPQVTYDGVPGNGGTVRAFTISYAPPPTPRDDNQYWQELERRLGVTWEIDITPQPNFGEKSAVYLAGGDLPDLFYINPGQNAEQQYQALAQGAFLDLTPYLTGDSLAQFQNLSTFPQFLWDNQKFQGKIFGVPKPVSRAGGYGYYRTDWAETLGLETNGDPESAGALLTAFATGDPDGDGSANTWGAGRFGGGWIGWDNRNATNSFRLPQGWRLNDDGTLVNMIETDEYREAIQYLTDLYAAGSYHPDSASMTFADAQNAFIAGATGFHFEGLTSFYGVGNVGWRQQEANPAARIGHLPSVGADGQPGVTWNGSGFFGYVAIPASLGGDEERVLELLRICDYLAAPFGSEEQLFLGNGIEGVHFDFNEQGAPIVNDLGRQEKGDLVYFMNGLETLFYPTEPEVGLEVQAVLKEAIAIGIDDPTLVLFSQTNIDQGPILDQLGADSINPIVTGREAFDALDAAIEAWKSQGGDQIRQEYEQALQDLG